MLKRWYRRQSFHIRSQQHCFADSGEMYKGLNSQEGTTSVLRSKKRLAPFLITRGELARVVFLKFGQPHVTRWRLPDRLYHRPPKQLSTDNIIEDYHYV